MSLLSRVPFRLYCQANAVHFLKQLTNKVGFVGDKAFWYFHESPKYRHSTLRDEATLLKSRPFKEIVSRKRSLNSKSIQHYSWRNKLFLLDAISLRFGWRDKLTHSFLEVVSATKDFDRREATELLQLLYHYSLFAIETKDVHRHSRNVSQVVAVIENNLDLFFESYNYLELVIMAHCLFKLRVKLSSTDIIVRFMSRCQRELDADTVKPFDLICTVKFIRFQNLFDESFVASVQRYLLRCSREFTFTEIAHLVALFANFRCFYPEVFELLCDRQSVHRLNAHFSNAEPCENKAIIRSKDLARFVWSLSQVNHHMNDGEGDPLEILVNHFEQTLETDVKKNPHLILDSLKSLAILGIYPLRLLSRVLNDREFLELMIRSKRSKVGTDMYFLLQSIAIQCPDLKLDLRSELYSLTKPIEKNAQHDLMKRPLLKGFLEHLEIRGKVSDLIFPLDHISIASVRCENKVYEVFDECLCLRGTASEPAGLFNSKLNQMRDKGVGFKSIKSCQQFVDI